MAPTGGAIEARLVTDWMCPDQIQELEWLLRASDPDLTLVMELEEEEEVENRG